MFWNIQFVKLWKSSIPQVIYFCCYLVTKSCPTLLPPVDCSPPVSSVHKISQASILEWVAILFSRGSSWPRDWTQVSCIAGRGFNLSFTCWWTFLLPPVWNYYRQLNDCELHVQPLCEHMFSFDLGHCTGTNDWMYANFLETLYFPSKEFVLFYIPTSNVWGFQLFFHTLIFCFDCCIFITFCYLQFFKLLS